jgi:hypothetical protein
MIMKKPHRFIVYALVPLLALGGYIAADLLFPVKPTPTIPTQPYRLQEQGLCNLTSGCILQHGDLVVRLVKADNQQGEQGMNVQLTASESLKGAAISIAGASDAGVPANMLAGDDHRNWSVSLNPASGQKVLRLLLSTEGAAYFAECPVTL